jgi:hypothetical protein
VQVSSIKEDGNPLERRPNVTRVVMSHKNPKFYVLLPFIVMLTGFLTISPAITSLMNSVVIRSRGGILVLELFDSCDRIGDWKPTSESTNTLEVNTADKVEGTGSLKGTLKDIWGGMFYKRPPSGSEWDFSDKPLIKVWIKLDQPLPNGTRGFELVTGPGWDSYHYYIFDQVPVGQWTEVTIDLRSPNKRPSGRLPNLAYGTQISFFLWSDAPITSPISFNWDNITTSPGPYIPPQIAISPLSKVMIKGESIAFSVTVLGGEQPFSYSWYVNEAPQEGETSNTFTFISTKAGDYIIKCVVTDSQNNSANITATVKVLNPPPPQPPIPQSLDVFKSEVRGMFIWTPWLRSPDWDVIAQTCFDYGINTAVIELPKDWIYDYETGSIKDNPSLRESIEAFHQRDIRVHVLLHVMMGAPEGMRTLRSTGEINWLDVTKPAARDMLRTIAESLARDYDIDGFMFDYIRWDYGGADMPLGEEAKQKFIADTNLTDVVWPDDVLLGGRYYWQFIEWRMKVIDEVVRDMVNWMKAIKPNLVFSAAVFPAFDNCGNWWPMRIGQHTAEWVDQGYLDFVSPMLYSDDHTVNGNNLMDSLNFYTGGAEGKIPMIPFITYYHPTTGETYSIESLVQTVTEMKNRGADGWILWAYGGPGLDSMGGRLVDVRPYLSALFEASLMEPIWAIQNFSISRNATHITVSWTTTVPTTSKIEYTNGKIFNGTIRYGDFDRPFHYKKIDYFGGASITDATLKTGHSFTISVTDRIEFRIQSIDANGTIITSRPISISEEIPP